MQRRKECNGVWHYRKRGNNAVSFCQQLFFPRPSEPLKIGSFKFPAPQGPKLHLNSPLKRRILWSITPLSKRRCLNGKKKGMVYSLSVVNVILTCSTMWNFIILMCLATECNTFERIIFDIYWGDVCLSLFWINWKVFCSSLIDIFIGIFWK